VEEQFLDKIQTDIVTLCNSGFNHKLYPDITISEDNVVNIYIPPAPSSLRPIYSPSRGLPKGGRVRVGSSNMQLDDEWLRRFAISAAGGAELLEFEGNYNNYYSQEAIDRYLKAVRKKRGLGAPWALSLSQRGPFSLTEQLKMGLRTPRSSVEPPPPSFKTYSASMASGSHR